MRCRADKRRVINAHPLGGRPVRPLLKWAGGKRQLLPVLRRYYPTGFKRYIEPFFGSGAVYFDLFASGRLAGRQAWILDGNPDLVGCYRALRDHTEAVIEELAVLERHHRAGGTSFYYEVRDRRFNPRRAAAPGVYAADLAAMLIYLNRTGFNGLFRLNRSGGYNVPAGRYENPTICDAAHLRRVAAALSARTVRIDGGSFEGPLESAGPGDFVYCDPPYAPLGPTARFAQYTAAGFGEPDQQRLQHAVLGAVRRGANVVLSNSSTPFTEALYGGHEARRAGLAMRRVPARRAINSRAALRGSVNEILVTNLASSNLPGRARPLKASLRRSVRTA
jgi:DNA adenine methylase